MTEEATQQREPRQAGIAREDLRINDTKGDVEVHCEAVQHEHDTVIIRYHIRNIGNETIHIINNGRVPYQLARDANTLVILHGIHPPPADRTFMLGMPVTRPLAAGEVHAAEVAWPRRVARDHYGWERTPASLLHGTIHVLCEAGWWTMPVTYPPPLVPFSDLLDTQQLVEYGPFDITLL